MLERYTLSTTRFHSQVFDETGCDYFLFPTPGKKDHITIDPEILSPSAYFEPSDETIPRLYGIPCKENYISDHLSQDRQESSISSQSVEYFPRYKHQRPKKFIPKFEFFIPFITLTLIYLYKPLLQLQHEHPYQHS